MTKALALLASPSIPELVAAAGDRAGVRFLEFFAANIRNPRWRHDLRYPRTQSVGLASAVQLGRDLFERAADDLATPSLISVILDKGIGRTTRYGLALRAGVRGD